MGFINTCLPLIFLFAIWSPVTSSDFSHPSSGINQNRPRYYSPATSSSERANLKDQEEQPEEEKQPSRLELLLAQSKFSCGQKKDGYYADTSVGCQIFHYCVQGAKHSWMCPEQTVFHQVHLNCVPAAQDICAQSEKFFVVNDYLHKEIDQRGPNNTIRYHQRYYPEEFLTDAALNAPTSFGFGPDSGPASAAVASSRPQSRPQSYSRQPTQAQPVSYGNSDEDDDSSAYSSPNQGYRQPAPQSYPSSTGNGYNSQSYRPQAASSRLQAPVPASYSASSSYPGPSSSPASYSAPSGYSSSQPSSSRASSRPLSHSAPSSYPSYGTSSSPSSGLRYSPSSASPSTYSAPSRPSSLAASTAPYSASGYSSSSYNPSSSGYRSPSSYSGLSSSSSSSAPSSYSLVKPSSSAAPSTASLYAPSSSGSGSSSLYPSSSSSPYRRPASTSVPSTSPSSYGSNRYPAYNRVSNPSTQYYPSSGSSSSSSAASASSPKDNYAPLTPYYAVSSLASSSSPSLSSRFSSALDEDSDSYPTSAFKSGVTYESDY